MEKNMQEVSVLQGEKFAFDTKVEELNTRSLQSDTLVLGTAHFIEKKKKSLRSYLYKVESIMQLMDGSL